MPEKTIANFVGLELDDTVRGLLIDLDNTLYAYAPCHDAGLKAVAREFARTDTGIDDFETSYEEARKIVKNRLLGQSASHSRLLYFYTMLAQGNREAIFEQSLQLESLYWTSYKKAMEPIAGLASFLAKFKKSGKKVGIVSDLTTRVQFEKIISLGIDHLIDFVVTSEEAGAEKPSEKIYALALEKIGLPATDVLMIGDDKERDINGSRSVGMRSIHIIHG